MTIRNRSTSRTNGKVGLNLAASSREFRTAKKKAMKQLGTLGGGNHFIEVCLDTEDNVWLMLHSGSRNIGNEVATRHIATAKTLHELNALPAPDLAYFVQGTDEFKAYWHDLDWSQRYAMMNREIMMKRLLKSFNRMFNDQRGVGA